MTTALAQTPLHDWHVAHGGRMVDFAGWSMPVQYSSIAAEHTATRNTVGVFDISHMGRIAIGRADAAQFLDGILTRRVTDMRLGQIRYSLVCNENGGILDDVLIYYGGGAAQWTLVVNASNREKIVDWIKQRSEDIAAAPLDLGFMDLTADSAMIAVQGPKSIEIMSPLLRSPDGINFSPKDLRYYHCQRRIDLVGEEVVLSRTGYTGEDGVEIICDQAAAANIWERIIAAAEKVGGMAAGLGARDTLRLEAAMPLYGHELSEDINPIQAGLSFAVNLEGREFVGRDAIKKFAADKTQPVRVGLQLDGKRLPRQGCAVLQNGEPVGEVTSGTYSPTFERPIAMAYVQSAAKNVGTQLAIDIRGTQHPAIVVPLPFYKRKTKD